MDPNLGASGMLSGCLIHWESPEIKLYTGCGVIFCIDAVRVANASVHDLRAA
jgi:hypothetical protein